MSERQPSLHAGVENLISVSRRDPGGALSHGTSTSPTFSNRLEEESTRASETATFIDRILGSSGRNRDNGRDSTRPTPSRFSTTSYQIHRNSYPFTSFCQHESNTPAGHYGKPSQPHSSEGLFGTLCNGGNSNPINNTKSFKACPVYLNNDRDNNTKKPPHPTQYQHLDQNSAVNPPLIQVPVTEAILSVQDNCAIRGLTYTSAWLGELYLSCSVTPVTSHGIEPTQVSNPITGEVLEPLMPIPVSCLLSADLSIHSEYYYSPVEGPPSCDVSREDDVDEAGSERNPMSRSGGASALRADDDNDKGVEHKESHNNNSTNNLTTPCRQSYFYQPPSEGGGSLRKRPSGGTKRKSVNISQQSVPSPTDMTGPLTRDSVDLRATSTASNSSYALAPFSSSSSSRDTHGTMVLSSSVRGEDTSGRGVGDDNGASGQRPSAQQVSFALRSGTSSVQRLTTGGLTPHNTTIPLRKWSPLADDRQGCSDEGNGEFMAQPAPLLAPFHHRALLATAKAYFDQGEYRRVVHTLQDLPVACVLGTRLSTSSGAQHDGNVSNGIWSCAGEGSFQDAFVDLSRQSITRTDRRAAFLCAYGLYKDGEKAKRTISSGTGAGAATALGVTSNNPNLKELLVMLEQSALQDFPDDGYLRWLYGVVLRESSRPQEAATAFVDAVKRNPLLWCAWEDLSKEVTHISDMEQIIAEYSIIFPSSGDGVANYNSGSAPVILECPFVKEIFAASVFLDLKYPLEAHIEIEKILRKKKSRRGVSGSVSTGPVVAIVDSNPALLLLTGYLHNRKRDYQAAIRVFDELHLKYPYQLEGMDEYGNALYMVGDRFTLCTLAQECYTVDAFRAESNIVAANYYSSLKRHDRSLYHFKRATQINPYLTSAWTLLGHEYIEAKNPSAAAQAYRAAIRIDRRDYRPWYGLGRIYELQQMSNYAVTYFWEAVALNPGDFRMWGALAACFERLRMPEDMTYCLEKIVSNFEESEWELETRRRNVAETGSLAGGLSTNPNTYNGGESGQSHPADTCTPSTSILFAGRVLRTATTIPEEAREHYKTCRLLVIKYTSWNPDKAAYYIQKMLASPYCTAADTVGFLPGLIQYFLAKTTEAMAFGPHANAPVSSPIREYYKSDEGDKINTNNESNDDDDDANQKPGAADEDKQGPPKSTDAQVIVMSYLESAEQYLERLHEYASSEEGIDEAGGSESDACVRPSTYETVFRLQKSINLIKSRLGLN